MNKLLYFSKPAMVLTKLPMLIVALFLLCIFQNKSTAQGCDTTFIRRIGNYAIPERAFKIIATPEGNLLIGGSKANSALISLVTPQGQLIWERSFDMGFGDDFIYDMLIDSDGKLAVIGRDLITPANYSFILRFDYLTQTLLWSSKMSNVTNPRFEALTQLPNGNYMVVGMVQAGSTGPDNLVLEVNKTTGSMVWQKTYNNGQTDVFLDAIVKDGSCYTANVQRYGGLEKIRAAVSKLDMTGSQIWTKSYIRDQTSNARNYAVSIKSVNDTLVVFGHGNLNGSSDIDYSLQLFATDLNGNIDWAKNYQLPGNNHNAGNVVVVPDGYVVSGTFSQNNKTEIFIMKVNRKGQKLWAKAIGSNENEYCRSIVYQDGHIYFAGHSNVFDGSNDILFGKMSLDGEVLGTSCSYVKDVQVTITNLNNPYGATTNMLNATGNYTMANSPVSPVAVASPIADVAGCGCQMFSGCTNLIVNSSFENGLAGWSVTGNVTTTNDSQDGTSAARICGSAPGSISQIYTAQAGQPFTASFWAKSDNPPNNANVELRFLNASFTPLTTGNDQQNIYSNVYQQYNLQALAPTGTAYVHFLVWKQGSQCVTIDNVEVCNQNGATGIPDLSISNVSLPTINANTVQAGSSLPVAFTLSNLGAGAAPSGFDVKIYVSSTPTLTSSSVLLSSLSQQSLTAGTSVNLSSSPVLSSSLTPGNYYLILVADQANTVAESNETNNQASSQAFTVYGSCAMVANVSTAVCHDNGTPNIVTDDYFSFTVSAINTIQSGGYYLTMTPLNQTLGIAYGVNFDVNNIPISTGNLSLLLTDAYNSNCTKTLTVAAPPACSVSLPDLVASNLTAPTSVNPSQTYTFNFTVTNSSNTTIPGVSNLNHSLYLSTDNQYDNADLLVGGSSFTTAFSPNAQVNYGPLNFNIPSVQAGNYFLVLFIDKDQAVPESNEANNKISIPVTVQNPTNSGQIDLSLTITNPTTAPIYTSYPTTIKITNSGSIPATGVKVVCQKPNGIVYTGGNEFTVSQGSFEPLTSQVWNVGTLAPGASATLTVNYFLLQSSLPVVYAQVTAANEQDVDSTPNNGTPPTPNEDDEASSAGGGSGPAPKPDLAITNLQIPNASVAAGAVLSYNFDASNIGTAAVPGNFTIKSYISNDQNLSMDDLQDGTIQTGNYGVGFSAPNVAGASTIPASLAAGQYYLIVKIDGDDAVSEISEGNNTLVKPFTVTSAATVCQGDLILESQAEVDAFSGCNIVDGDLIIRSPNGSNGASSDITDLGPLLSLQQVNGNLIILNNDQLTNLHGLENLTSIGGLSIVFCENLISFQELAGLVGELNHISIIGNATITSLQGLNGITKTRSSVAIEENASLQSLNGLSGLTSVATNGTQYSLGIVNNPSLVDLQALQHLTNVGGSFYLTNCTALENLNGLQSLTSVGRDMVLVDNIVLKDVSALNALTTVGDNLPVQRNYLLADCCIFRALLAGNGIGGTAFFSDNASGCNSSAEIIANCTPQGVDLQLTMTATNPSPGIYTSFPVKLTITNAGGQAATGVEVAFPRPAGVVYEGGNEFTASKGAFNAFGNERWYLGDLAAGESATITVSYFLLTSNALHPYAQVFACNEPDSDSSPNNGTSPTPNEDDEATIGINSLGSRAGNAVVRSDNRRRLNFDRIYPNPTQYLVTFDLYSYQQQAASLDIYDQQGRLVHSMQLDLEEGQNLVELWVSDWKSGTYNLIARGEKSQLPAYGRFLKVWEE